MGGRRAAESGVSSVVSGVTAGMRSQAKIFGDIALITTNSQWSRHFAIKRPRGQARHSVSIWQAKS